jgi:hypothetical protein
MARGTNDDATAVAAVLAGIGSVLVMACIPFMALASYTADERDTLVHVGSPGLGNQSVSGS